MKVVIIGGVAGGASCATRMRRMDENAEIVMFERGEHVSYANCGLPYYLGGTIRTKGELLVATPEFLKRRFRIDVRVRSEVVAIDRKAKKVRVREDDGREYDESYDKLVLAPGASAKTFGLGGEGTFTLRSVNDALAMDGYIRKNGARSALVAGGGFIGLETAENLAERGLKVTLAEFAPQVMPPLDPEMAVLVEDELRRGGVRVMTGKGVGSVVKTGRGVRVTFTDGSVEDTDLVVLAMGVSPETALASVAGLELASCGGLETDEYMRTSDPDVYAAGDAVAVLGPDGGETLIPLAGPANRQGRSIADNIAGGDSSNGKRVRGASVVKVFGRTAASVGSNEKQLKKAGREYLKAYALPLSHAGYYPGASNIVMKLLFSKDGGILGAQAVGTENVEKQIDALSAFMQMGGTVRDLAEFEACYAPPYGSAKSPVNMLGFIACNILDGLAPTVSAENVTPEYTVLDVRTPAEYASGHIPGAVNIPLDELRDRLSEVPSGKLAVTCAVGLRGYLAVRVLRQRGFDAYNVSGGMSVYGLAMRAGLIKK